MDQINNDYSPIVLGLLAGFCYYRCFERRKINKQFDMECWAKLHYMEKENSSLVQVHLKSMMVGLIIIILSLQGCVDIYKKALSFFGATIIGLHIGQYINEREYIKNGNNKI
ncbi:hypothetical protein QKU48_gp1217 [Fadolivirus algeromassiliense]|jgi:predicted ABC-type exoprotein transport system permease subunit|uniref:Uncharacterized protein n=1 Tax=Fadolivirus FV1/VV64 TaxID=3070911 RepID=A0A7D3V5Z1_9VIRU|nr:hypothetical protein QKU48_gp1217 [Fadolivirus algeromassiliense]QKF94675.1 hypothetical protein Fadolivirus_1_1217 [Fadolivirus FV1/VV64]